MKIEYLAQTGDSFYESILRIFDFDENETVKLYRLIREKVIEGRQPLELHALDFVTPANCELTLKCTDKNQGVYDSGEQHFVCEMDQEHYLNMWIMLYNSVSTNGHYFLDGDVESGICLLFSKGGGW